MEAVADSEKLIVEKHEGTGLVLFNQPGKHNAISYEMWQGLAGAMRDFADDDGVRVVVIAGTGGRAFSAGADISQFEAKRGTADAIDEYNAAVKAALAGLRGIAKPTIARIAGYCLGGGLGVAVACDLRIAADDATFAIPAARLGLGYGFDALRALVDLVGPSFAKEVLYTARRFDAHEALAMGLVNRVRPAAELEGYVGDYAARIAGNAPLTVRATKGIVEEVLADPGARDLDRCARLVDDCYASADYAEGRRAFMEKRKPRFEGR